MKLFLRKGTNRLHGRYKKCYVIVLIGSNGYYIDEVQYRDENGLHKMRNWNRFETIEDVTKEAMRMADKLREMGKPGYVVIYPKENKHEEAKKN